MLVWSNIGNFLYRKEFYGNIYKQTGIRYREREKDEKNGRMYTAFGLSCKIKMQKLKLLPTLKEKKRYLVYQASDDLENHNSLIEQCNSLLGIFEGSKAGLQLISSKNSRGIIRVATKYLDKLKFCLSIIKEVGGKKVSIKTVYASGLLNKAKQKMKT